MTSQTFVEKFGALVNRSVVRQERKEPNSKPVFRVEIYGDAAIQFLSTILPYLLTEQKQKVALELSKEPKKGLGVK